MHALWTRIGRLGASIMLVAALAFAFHTGVVAASGTGGSPDVTSASRSQESRSPHDHARGEHGVVGEASGAHLHAEAAKASSGQGEQHDGKGHCKTNCCGAACTIAVLSTPAFQVTRVEVSSVLTELFVPASSGIDPSGLKRPPRTPSIA